MSIIHLVLLAKAIEEQQKRTGAKQTSSQPEKKKKNDNYESALNDYYNNSMDAENFLEALLSTDPEATKLFLLLKDCQKQINEEDRQNSLEEVQRICAEYDEQAKVLQTEINNLKNQGIALDSTSTITKYYGSVKVEEGHGFGNYGSYSYNPDKYLMGFNGMPLTREMIVNNINQFQIDLDNLNKENPNLDEQLNEIQTKIAKQKRNLKYNPFNKSKNQSLLTDMLKLEKEIQEKINYRTTLEKQSITFAKLTAEQKKAIISYMDQVANCMVIGEQLSIAINKSFSLRYDDYNTRNLNKERNVNQRIIERAAEQSDFSIEEIHTIIDSVKVIMDANKYSDFRYKKISDKPYHHPTTPESMFAAKYYDEIYQDKRKAKNH